MALATWRYGQRLRQLRKDWGNHCVRCGARRRLEFAHLKATMLAGRGRGMRQRYLDIVRHPSSYTLLCQACHRIIDNPYAAYGSIA